MPNEVFPEVFPGNQVKSVIILLLARLAAVAAGGRAGRARARGAAARRALGGAGAGAARAAAVGITGAGHDGLSVLLGSGSVQRINSTWAKYQFCKKFVSLGSSEDNF